MSTVVVLEFAQQNYTFLESSSTAEISVVIVNSHQLTILNDISLTVGSMGGNASEGSVAGREAVKLFNSYEFYFIAVISCVCVCEHVLLAPPSGLLVWSMACYNVCHLSIIIITTTYIIIIMTFIKYY